MVFPGAKLAADVARGAEPSATKMGRYGGREMRLLLAVALLGASQGLRRCTPLRGCRRRPSMTASLESNAGGDEPLFPSPLRQWRATRGVTSSGPRFVSEDASRGTYVYEVEIGGDLGLGFTESDGPLVSGGGKGKGVYVDRVDYGSSAADGGVRVGDRVVATSATLGESMWEKRTVSGVMSALQTRLAIAPTVKLQLERGLVRENMAARRSKEATFDVIVKKPLGLKLSQPVVGGPVVVQEVQAGSNAESVGVLERDVIVAVSNSVGSQMWPTKSVEGVISAVTTNIWSEGVQLRIRRKTMLEGEESSDEDEGSSAEAAEAAAAQGARQKALNMRMVDATRKRDARGAIFAFEDALSEGLRPNNELLCSLAVAYGALQKGRSALRHVARVAETYGVAADTALLNSLLHACGRSSLSLGEALFHSVLDGWRAELRPSVPNPSPDASEKAWVGVEESVSGEGVAELCAALRGLPLDTSTFNTMMNAYCGRGKVREAKRVFREMERQGLAPDVRSFTILMKGFARAGETDKAIRTLKKMRGAPYGLEPDAQCFHTIIEGYCRANQLDRAERVFLLLSRNGIAPLIASYSCMMVAQLRAGRLAGVLEKLDALLEDGLEPNAYVYSSVVTAHARLGDLVGSLSVLREMKSRGVAANAVVYTAVAESCIQNRQASLALQILGEARRDGAIAMDAKAFSTLGRASLKAGNFSDAVAAMDDARAGGFEVLDDLYAAALFDRVREEDFASASALLERYLSERRAGREAFGTASNMVSDAVASAFPTRRWRLIVHGDGDEDPLAVSRAMPTEGALAFLEGAVEKFAAALGSVPSSAYVAALRAAIVAERPARCGGLAARRGHGEFALSGSRSLREQAERLEGRCAEMALRVGDEERV